MQRWKVYSVCVEADEHISYCEAFCRVLRELDRLGEAGKYVQRIKLAIIGEDVHLETVFQE